MTYFNPRTREGCDLARFSCRRLLFYFNPRTREGCDYGRERYPLFHPLISIHAPVKGATPDGISVMPEVKISIHAPVKGATHEVRTAVKTANTFQSTHP